MVADPRTPPRPDQLRPLNRPRPVAVLTHPPADEGGGGEESPAPAALIKNGRRCPVAAITDTWSVVDEWWRQPIDRRYYRLVLADGRVRTVYHDRIADTWAAQAY